MRWTNFPDLAISKLKHQPAFIKKYVDDLIVAAKESEMEELSNVFNSKAIDENIKFTMERENNEN